ncbi:hypothetical protein RB614_14255 [Phytohabitans sp. ZYX-F-186]|uniref:Secreted protein n=1 Tax=Phytohabitans maris TaxID=3071409 RepID=A0ABU0ZIA3_9ACTN|nr:hypothetical protein [Phytohabitans sp. ZYX-F-186]MDQ7905677.1 hypothetical protein [Phytohabitans sp. ZYX-F-186]
MNTPTRMAGYALGLAAVFAAALGAGKVVGGPEPAPPVAAHDGGGHGDGGDGGHDSAAAEMPGGLQVAQDGYRLSPVSGGLPVGDPAPFQFRILGPDGTPVTGYTPTHEKQLHLIAVRRDLTGFQHVHPTMAADGTWSVPLAADAPGQYRIFADFQPAARAQALTLGVDVPARGDYRPAPLPAPERSATVDGYTVTLAGDLVPGTASKLTLTVSRGGRPVTDLQPYLAAYGHLVALRDGDLAYLHVHPDGEPGDGRTAPGPEITFYAEVPSAGAYRLFLDFQHAGKVRTAAFTATAGGAELPAAPGHDDDGHTHG